MLWKRAPASKIPLVDQLKTVFENLFHLEINTIIKDNMTGQKMPAPEHALVDLAAQYDFELTKYGSPRGELDTREPTGGPAEFERLRIRSAQLISEWSKDPALSSEQRSELYILCRIRDNADQLKSVFEAIAQRGKKVPDDLTHANADQNQVELLADEFLMLRKAWEIGVEQIAFQTVVQLDGDVVTRVQPRFAATSEQAIWKVHDMSLQASLSFWRQLVDVLEEFAGFLVRLVK